MALGLLAAAVASAAPAPALASDGGAAGAAISPVYTAPRYVHGSDAGAPAHLNDFSPAAINFTDCTGAIDIQLTLDLTSPPAGDEIQVWAGAGSADCTQTSARTAGASATPDSFPGRCWPVAASGTYTTAAATTTARLHVLDLVSGLGQTNPPVTYTPTTSTSACRPAGITGPVGLNLYFLYVPAGSGSGSVAAAMPDGVSGLYQVTAALVGPVAPTDVQLPSSGVTPTGLTVNWVPQFPSGTSDIQGFNIYAEDQGPNGVNAGGGTTDATATLTTGVQCHPQNTCVGTGSGSGSGVADAGAPDAAGDAGADATVDAASDAAADATVDAGADTGSGSGSGSSGGAGCDAGLSDAWVAVDAAAYPDATPAALAQIGCEYTAPVNAQNTGSGGGGGCTSSVLVDTFTVDGGLGTSTSTGDATAVATTTADAGDAGDSGATTFTTTTTASSPETAGISAIPTAYLAYYSSGTATASYTLSGLITGDQYAVAVAAVDTYGNVGALGQAITVTGAASGVVACSTPTAVDDFFTQYATDGGLAGGGFCALAAVGAPKPMLATMFGASLAGAALARARRRRKKRSTRS